MLANVLLRTQDKNQLLVVATDLNVVRDDEIEPSTTIELEHHRL